MLVVCKSYERSEVFEAEVSPDVTPAELIAGLKEVKYLPRLSAGERWRVVHELRGYDLPLDGQLDEHGVEHGDELLVLRDSHGAGPMEWITAIAIALPITAFVQGFFSRFGEAAADRLSDLVVRLADTRGAPDVRAVDPGRAGEIALRDPEGAQVLLRRDLPLEAYRELGRLDWEGLDYDVTLRWDEERGKWRPL